eukprot:SAG31_NODE_9869_length_1218_cov_1.946381_2_plen_51_part_01
MRSTGGTKNRKINRHVTIEYGPVELSIADHLPLWRNGHSQLDKFDVEEGHP